MNDLSWLIYLADVVPTAARVLFGWSVAGLIVFGGLVGIGMTDIFGEARYGKSKNEPEYNEYYNEFNIEAMAAIRLRKLWFMLPICFFIMVLTCLVPANKETFYAIAASELGEEVINSPTVGKAVKALDTWLDRQISKAQAEDVTV